MCKIEDKEATQLANQGSSLSADSETSTSLPSSDLHEKKMKINWKKTGAGVAGGLLIGGVAAMLMDSEEVEASNTTPEGPEGHVDSHPAWTDDDMSVATSVNDNMSFDQAFASARAEVGPGGCFEWHGGVYGTYTAAEWNHMSAAERSEYSDHFNWGALDHSTSHVASHTTSNQAHYESHSVHAETTSGQHHADGLQQVTAETTGDEVEVISVNNEVEVLGVVHDYETGANIGGVLVDQQEVVLIDIDGDLEFDVMASDINHNGALENNEVADIHGQGLTVDTLGGFSDPMGGSMVSDDSADFYSDGFYEV